MIMTAFNRSLLWDTSQFAPNEYDTFWTIGKLSGDAPGSDANWLSNPEVGGDQICSAQVGDGGAFLTGAPVNAIAGDDLKVVVARITTCGDWTLNLNLQVFVEGNPTTNLFLGRRRRRRHRGGGSV